MNFDPEKETNKCVVRSMTNRAEEWAAKCDELLAENERLREALVQAERLANINRVWGGMEWKYHACPEFRIKKISEMLGEALKGE